MHWSDDKSPSISLPLNHAFLEFRHPRDITSSERHDLSLSYAHKTGLTPDLMRHTLLLEHSFVSLTIYEQWYEYILSLNMEQTEYNLGQNNNLRTVF